MWASREMLKDNTDQQLYVKTTLRELIVYSFFLMIICYASFAQYTPMNHRLTATFKSLFEKQMDVTNFNKFWKFLEGDLINGVYWDTLYNRGYRRAQVRCPDSDMLATEPCPVPPSDRNIMYENRVLGLPRMRQVSLRLNSSQKVSCDSLCS